MTAPEIAFYYICNSCQFNVRDYHSIWYPCGHVLCNVCASNVCPICRYTTSASDTVELTYYG